MYDWNGNGNEDPGDYIFDQMYQSNSDSRRQSSPKGEFISWISCLFMAGIVVLVCQMFMSAVFGCDFTDATAGSFIAMSAIAGFIKSVINMKRK